MMINFNSCVEVINERFRPLKTEQSFDESNVQGLLILNQEQNICEVNSLANKF